MKKILSLILCAALLCACTLTLASCGTSLEGTYEGAFVTDEEDILTITFGKDNAVTLSLSVAGGERTDTATGTYKLTAEEDHGHEVMTFDIKGDKIGLLSFLQNTEYTYSIDKVDGKKQLSLSAHSSYGENMVLTEVKE
ncbi:MAG: hypothetical protein J6K14_04850 [Clostridia bacterium]|nr:hypothetical protein [Clostridia bacterium]